MMKLCGFCVLWRVDVGSKDGASRASGGLAPRCVQFLQTMPTLEMPFFCVRLMASLQIFGWTQTARDCLASLLLVLRAKDAGVRFVVLKKSSAK